VTKKSAAEKVAKLHKLARGSSSPHEAESARAQAEKIAAEHGLSSRDLETGQMGAAFDELVDQVGKIASSLPQIIPQGLFDTRTIVDQVLRSIKSIGEVDKAARLRQFTTLVRTAAFIAGDNKTIAEVKTALDTALRNHELVL
jgi:hypothetical protein